MGALVELWYKIDGSVKLLDDHFANDKAQTYPVRIKLPFLIFDRAKKLKQFILILFFNTNSRILDIDFDKISFEFCCYLDCALSICKLDRIWKQVENDLLEPFLVGFD